MRKQFREMVFSVLPIVWLLLHPAGSTLVAEVADLPENLAMFCPDVDVCPERNFKQAWNDTGDRPGKVACCKECSCDDACVQTNTCCFPPTDQHPGSTCLYPTTPSPAEGHALPYTSYRMIDRDESTFSGNSSSTSGVQNADETPCGEVAHPPLGNLLPVYSKRTNKIYKNPTCAKSHGVTDGVIWDVSVFCQNWFHPQTSAAFQSLEYGTISSECYVDFVYPSNAAHLDLHVCYRDMQRTCDRDTFPIPERLNVTANQVRAFCESGLISPWYIPNTLYANVFCMLCDDRNTNKFKITMKMCMIEKPIRNRKHGLSYLLHMNQFGERGTQPKVIMPEVCDARHGLLNVNKCRQLKCPTSQFRGPDGKCAYMVYNKEDTNTYMMVLRVHVDNFKVSSNGDFAESTEELMRLWNKVNPWPKQGSIYGELKPTNSTDPQIKSLLVEAMVSPPRSMPFQTLLKTVKTYINKRWVIEANGSYITLHQSWAEFSNVVTSHELGTLAGLVKGLPNYYVEIDPASLIAYNITETLMLRLRQRKSYLMSIPSLIYLNKLYYCEQIELQPHEFIMYKVVRTADHIQAEAIYSKHIGRLMFENEFMLVNTPNGQFVARICLSDSSFKKIAATSGAGEMHLFLVAVLSLGWCGLQITSI